MKERKILSLLLSLCLLIGLLPTAALAADQTNDGAGIRIVQGDAYDSNTGIFSIKVQAKLPVGTGISSVGTLLSYDNTKLAVVNKNNTSKDVTSNEGVKKESEAIISKTLIQTVDDDENTKEYTLQDSAMYKAGDRSGIYTFHYNGKPLTQKATDAQTGGKWFDVYEVMFRVTGKPTDPATVLNSDSLRIADVAKGDDAVMKGAFPANDIYSIYLTDNSDPAKLYVLNRMSGCTATEVTGEKSLMTAPDTGTATYPGSTNSPSATTYTVTVQNDGNGTASASPATAAAGTEITLSATANSGYHFKEWQVVSGTVSIAGNKFTMPSSDVTVKAIFEADAPTTYTVTVQNDGNGTASASPATAAAGTEITLSATANSGYHFKEWQVVSGTVSIAGNKFNMPSSNVTVKAIFEADAPTTYTVTVQNDGNGTASASPATAAAGTEITLSATANSGYHFKEWQVVSGTVTIAGNKFNMPSSNVTVKAIFEADATTTYTVTFEANGGTASETSKQTGADGKLASLPTASRSRYSFDGWYTAASGGTQITTAHVFYGNTTVYAHWTYIGGSSSGVVSAPTYPITVDKSVNGSVSVSNGSAVKDASVTITVKPDKGYTLETLTVLDKNGYALELTEKNGRFTFKMPASAVIVKATFMDDNTMLNLFVDVKASDYFYDAVLWAAEKGVTSGTDALHFSPNAPCTRAQIVTFLWRAAGSPAPKNMSSFADVPADAFYAKAVAWAVENGITGGTGDGKFSPDATCTRAQAVTFLYRASGAPAVSGNAAFSDVATNAYYAAAVKWAEKNGITGGIGGGLFGSNNNCTRAQIVTFLYRSVK